jgi:hypothetical protein
VSEWEFVRSFVRSFERGREQHVYSKEKPKKHYSDIKLYVVCCVGDILFFKKRDKARLSVFRLSNVYFFFFFFSLLFSMNRSKSFIQ